MFSGDVSGAFDNVDSARLCSKLRLLGIFRRIVDVIDSWLQPRTARVVLDGSASDEIGMTNMVYQGTVWGPCLWNCYFADARFAIRDAGFIEIVYADDLNAFKMFGNWQDNEMIMNELIDVQRELHHWGAANRVVFDASKEHHIILSRTDPLGDDFRLLGIEFDCKLLMHVAIREVVTEASRRVKALLKTQRYYSKQQLIILYKQQILSYIEYRTPAIAHACSSLLASLDRIQDNFLTEIGITEHEALLVFNLAPLAMRRDVAMRGVIQGPILKAGPDQLETFFQFGSPPARLGGHAWHSRHLRDPYRTLNKDYLNRSLLGYVAIYNLLPERVVRSLDVHAFQAQCQWYAKGRIMNPRWRDTFSARVPLHNHPLR